MHDPESGKSPHLLRHDSFEDLIELRQFFAVISLAEPNFGSAFEQEQGKPEARIDANLADRRTTRALPVLAQDRQGLAKGRLADVAHLRVARAIDPGQHGQTVGLVHGRALERTAAFVDDVQAGKRGRSDGVPLGDLDDQGRRQSAAGAHAGHPRVRGDARGHCVGVHA